MEYRVRFISYPRRYEHHSAHSGYDQLVPRLGRAIEPLDLSSVRHTWIPGRVAVWLAARSGIRRYSYRSFYEEWAAMRDMISPRAGCWGRDHTVYHILYGESTYRYLGSAGWLLGSSVVATFHQPPALLERDFRSLAHLDKLQGIIVVGKNQIPFFEPIVGSARVFWVPHGVDTTVFCPAFSRRSGLDTAHGGIQAKPSSSGLCLFVGVHMRDFETLRRVMEQVWRQNQNLRFVLVTAGEQFGLLADLENVELRCGISEAELVGLYQSADLFLQPLLDSTANNSILEAMSCGLPVIASDVGGVRDYLGDECGVLVPPRDAEAMAEAVLSLWADEPARHRMAARARPQAERFDWSVVTEQTRQVYERVLARTGPWRGFRRTTGSHTFSTVKQRKGMP
jgi:glycosyltransferase involved in cell wall biosynthesis